MRSHYSNVETDAFVVKPNHIHGIIVLIDDKEGPAGRPAGLGGSVISAFIRVIRDSESQMPNPALVP